MKESCGSCGKEFLRSALEHGRCISCRGLGLNDEPLSEQELARKSERILLTTAPSIGSGQTFVELEVITAECVLGMNIFRDLFAGVRDIVGGRSSATQKILKDLRTNCLTELRIEAQKLGADAVIGIDLDYSEFSGKNNSMLFLVASGTAVKFQTQNN